MKRGLVQQGQQHDMPSLAFAIAAVSVVATMEIARRVVVRLGYDDHPLVAALTVCASYVTLGLTAIAFFPDLNLEAWLAGAGIAVGGLLGEAYVPPIYRWVYRRWETKLNPAGRYIEAGDLVRAVKVERWQTGGMTVVCRRPDKI